jgi:hypothetical protein
MGNGYGKHVTCKITKKNKRGEEEEEEEEGEKKSLNSGSYILIIFYTKPLVSVLMSH